MKKVAVLASLAAGLGVFAAPAMAQNGHIGVSYGESEVDDVDSTAINIDGAIAFSAGALAIKLDGFVGDTDTDGVISTDSTSQSFGGTVHLGVLNESQAFGGYAGYVDVDSDKFYVVGGEYAKFLGNSTFVVGAGFGQIDETDVDIYGVNGEFRFFVSDDFRLDLGASWINADGPGGDADGIGAGVGLEYRLPGSPISIGANYQYSEVDDLNSDGSMFGVSLRFDFGSGSLKARDRNGAGTFDALGGFGGAASLF
jgi:hypothetical protein